MSKFPVDVPKQMPDGSTIPLTIPNHARIKVSTLMFICTQSGISREEFMEAYDKS